MTNAPFRLMMTTGALALLAACEGGLPDFDLRDMGNGFDTSQAVANLPDRPAADDRGVISYPNYQVAVARTGDNVTTVATRLGINAGELARFNGIAPDTVLRAGELMALPSRVSEPSPATGAATTGPIQPLDVTAIATSALDRVGDQPAATTTPATAAAPTATGVEPIRHKVLRGETVFSLSRLYNVPVSNIAEWNSLGSDLTVREGQFLLIPQPGSRRPAPTPVTDPGAGTPTPTPPSATQPLPAETPPAATETLPTPPTPDTGAAANAPAAPAATNPNASLIRPVSGTVIRDYAPGRNEGIDIGVPAGTAVKAAASGSVAAVTTDTNGVAIVVLKHPDNLLTVYTNLDGLSVAKGDSVRSGQTIGKVRAGDPSFLHFETRRGLQSVDPNTLLP